MFKVINENSQEQKLEEIDFRSNQCHYHKLYIAIGRDQSFRMLLRDPKDEFYWSWLYYDQIGHIKPPEVFRTLSNALKYVLDNHYKVYGCENIEEVFSLYRKYKGEIDELQNM